MLVAVCTSRLACERPEKREFAPDQESPAEARIKPVANTAGVLTTDRKLNLYRSLNRRR